MKSVWQQYTATAEKYNEPGRFTAMIGYEWTSVPAGNNLHRNIMFRDGKDMADQVFPFSSWQSEDPEKLWAWMAQYEQKTGGKLLAIAHNANLSNGRMFELQTFTGAPLTREYAERRARYDVLQEIVQTKGNSETHPGISPGDEFAGDLGVAGWEYGNLTLTDKPLSQEMMPTNYVRAGLLRGLEQEAKLGVNPFKVGIVGSTDVHNSLTAIEEDNFFGKMPIQEPSPTALGARLEGRLRQDALHLALPRSGLCRSVGHRKHPRGDLGRDAAQGGARHLRNAHDGTVLRWLELSGDRRTQPGLGRRGLCQGRAHGRRSLRRLLQARPRLSSSLQQRTRCSATSTASRSSRAGSARTARRRSASTTSCGAMQSDASPARTASCPGSAIQSTSQPPPWTNTIGDPELSAVWRDPDFDPAVRAFYYARVIEIPTPRWTAYDQMRFNIKMSSEVPMSQQERAWSSPIWYTPGF